jgi:uncharacterized heparinase superfamily protein
MTSGTAKLAWYARRLQSMSPPELAHRVGEAARRRRYRTRPPTVGDLKLEWSGTASILGDIVLDWSAAPSAEPYVRQRTAEWLAGDIELMGHRWPAPEQLPSWHHEPFTGTELPLQYCFDVGYRHGASAGEVRLVWELNRLLWLLPPVAQAVLDADESLAATCNGVVDDWMAANPPRRGVNWSAGIEVAHHVVALVTLEQLIGRVLPDEDRRRRRMQRLAVMLDWIRRFPSLYSSANNHRICELAATVVAGCSVEGLCSHAELEAVGAELETCAVAQHAGDGCNAEQAPHYGAFTLEWLALSSRVADRSGRPFSSGLLALLHRSAGTLAALTDKGGHTVRYGDDDDASVLSFVLPPERRLLAVLDLAGLDSTGTLEARAPGLRQLGDCWYTVASSSDPLGETFLVFDHAPLGFGALAAHGHADALSIWLSVGGQPLLIEAGTYLYHAQPEMREWFRSTRAHNTLSVGGLDSSVPAGSFNWRRDLRASCEIVRIRDEKLYQIEAQHDGYESRLGTRHVRSVQRVAEGRYRIEDCLTGAALHRVEATFVIAPGHDVERQGSGWRITRPDRAVFRLAVSSGFELHEVKGSRSPLDGWCSEGFGQLEPTWVLRATGELGGGRRLDFDLDVTGAAQPAS